MSGPAGRAILGPRGGAKARGSPAAARSACSAGTSPRALARRLADQTLPEFADALDVADQFVAGGEEPLRLAADAHA